jgi:thiol-disulfide isomerase/thioredoxin
MKSFFVLLFISLASTSIAQTSGIRFTNDSLLIDILKKTKTDNKLIFMDCYTSWCAPCRMMDKQVYSDNEVGRFFRRNFLSVKFDMEKSEGIIIKKKFNVEAYPTFLFLNPKGELVFKAVGFADPKSFINIAQDALNANINILTNKVNSKGRTATDIFSFLLANPRYTKKDSLMNLYYTMISPENRLSIEAWTLFDRYVTDIDCDYYKYFLGHRKQFEDKYGAKKVSDKLVYSFMTYSDKYHNDKAKMKTLWDIDPAIVSEALFRNGVNYALENCENDKTNKVFWDTLINKTNIKYQYNSIYDLFFGASYVCENYKPFNDTLALQSAKKWALKILTISPQDDTFNNVYAHILFELGDIKEAIKYEEIAIARATDSKSLESVKKYNSELDRFRKSLTK